MKNLIIVLCLVTFLFGCTSDKENIAIVEKYIQAVENKDFDGMAELLDENYLGIGPSVGDSTNKIQALESWAQNIETLYKKIEYQRSRNAAVTVDDGENQGNWVSNWAQLQITYQSNDESILIWANTNYLVQNGKIIKSYTFYNEADALSQLGYVFIDIND